MTTSQLITTRDRIRTLPERYARQYGDRYPMKVGDGPTAGEVIASLLTLDLETCTVDDLARVASYLPGWVRIECGACRRYVDLVIALGDLNTDEPDPPYLEVCAPCLVGAVKLLPAPNGGKE